MMMVLVVGKVVWSGRLMRMVSAMTMIITSAKYQERSSSLALAEIMRPDLKIWVYFSTSKSINNFQDLDIVPHFPNILNIVCKNDFQYVIFCFFPNPNM